MSRPRKRFYAVRKGREVGIYTVWEECERQVKGFPGAKFKGFMIYKDAEAYIDQRAPSEERKG